MKFKRLSAEPAQINLTPLIDVVFLLLIFFVVSTSFKLERPIELTLPTAKISQHAVQQPVQVVELMIDKKGRFWLDSERIETNTDTDLTSFLAGLGIDPSSTVRLVADANAEHR
ncbi:MAG: ExbD/TolR family protein, partial [Pontibacterium sp.]